MKRFILFLAFICCALSISAQNMRRIEGEVKNHLGVSIPNATLQVYGVDKVYSTDANGKFSIDVPIQAFAITVFSEGYKAKFMEIDGTYMLFILRPDFAKEKKERLLAEKEVVAKAKAEAERKASEEKARLVAEQETVRIATEKAKAEEKAKITAQKEAEAKTKRAEEVHKTIDRNIRMFQYLKIDKPDTSYTELGNNYLYGKGKELNIAKAFLCYNLGAKQGETEAFLHIAHYYETGCSFDRFYYLEQNSIIALAFYEKAEALQVSGAAEGIIRIRKQIY